MAVDGLSGCLLAVCDCHCRQREPDEAGAIPFRTVSDLRDRIELSQSEHRLWVPIVRACRVAGGIVAIRPWITRGAFCLTGHAGHCARLTAVHRERFFPRRLSARWSRL